MHEHRIVGAREAAVNLAGAGAALSAGWHWPPLSAALGLPEGHQLCGAMLVGEPKYRYRRLPARREPQIDWR